MANKKVLIIEDLEDILELEEMILRPEGYEVKSVQNPTLAVNVANDFMPDVILLDLNLPKLSGWELYDIFRSDTRFSSIPIAIVTASDSGIDKMCGMLKKTDAYITKPFGRRELLDTVSALCSN